MSSSDKFYEEITGFGDFSLFTRSEYYHPLPADWFVVITDIQGSTEAIAKGLYKEVNSISIASLVAILNIFTSLKIPYVFGGDGATICIPSSDLESVRSALAASRKLADESFGLKLRIGVVPVSIIHEQGHSVLVGKYQPSPHFQQAMFQGDGLRFAESLVKEDRLDNPYILSAQTIADGCFDGFECRWNEIPSSQEETVAIMVQVVDQDGGSEKAMYEDICETITDIYGDESDHHPLREKDLSLSLSPGKLSIESRIRTAFTSAVDRYSYLLKLLWLSCTGRYLMANHVRTEIADWGQYRKSLIENTDYRKFDEILRMVICGTEDQRLRLTSYLETIREQKKIIYGIHASPSAIITCVVTNYNKDHVHFLDGSNGGYAMAATGMKQQLERLRSEKK